MQAYPSRGHREHYYSVVEEEEVVEEDHMHYKDNYHHNNNNGPSMHMKPNNQWYPQPKHDKIHKNGGYGGHGEHKYGRENYYEEEEEYRESWTEKNGFSGHNEGNNKHRMNKYAASGAPYDSGVHGGGYGAHHGNKVEHQYRPSYGGYECDEQRNGKSIWNFKGIVDE